jgi:hypothetical protein
MRLAGGRVTDEQLRQEARERKQRSRERKKTRRPLSPPRDTGLPPPRPAEDSVTPPYVTESPEATAEQRKREYADAELSPQEKAAKASARALAEFTVACRTWLPRMTVADQQRTLEVAEETISQAAQAEAA